MALKEEVGNNSHSADSMQPNLQHQDESVQFEEYLDGESCSMTDSNYARLERINTHFDINTRFPKSITRAAEERFVEYRIAVYLIGKLF